MTAVSAKSLWFRAVIVTCLLFLSTGCASAKPLPDRLATARTDGWQVSVRPDGSWQVYGWGSVESLEGMPVRELYVRCVCVSNYSLLRKLPVENLGLYGTDIEDLNQLAGMPLRELFLGWSRVWDLTPIQQFHNLRSLDIYQSPVTNLAPLASLPLQSLWMTCCPATDLSPLRKTPLKVLGLGHVAVSDLSPLENTPLEELALRSTKVTDLTPLVRMKHLRYLSLEASDADLSVLTNTAIECVGIEKCGCDDLFKRELKPLLLDLESIGKAESEHRYAEAEDRAIHSIHAVRGSRVLFDHLLSARGYLERCEYDRYDKRPGDPYSLREAFVAHLSADRIVAGTVVTARTRKEERSASPMLVDGVLTVKRFMNGNMKEGSEIAFTQPVTIDPEYKPGDGVILFLGEERDGRYQTCWGVLHPIHILSEDMPSLNIEGLRSWMEGTNMVPSSSGDSVRVYVESRTGDVARLRIAITDPDWDPIYLRPHDIRIHTTDQTEGVAIQYDRDPGSGWVRLSRKDEIRGYVEVRARKWSTHLQYRLLHGAALFGKQCLQSSRTTLDAVDIDPPPGRHPASVGSNQGKATSFRTNGD